MTCCVPIPARGFRAWMGKPGDASRPFFDTKDTRITKGTKKSQDSAFATEKAGNSLRRARPYSERRY
jgi:hypothetical protein